jgi:hypothetical protein
MINRCNLVFESAALKCLLTKIFEKIMNTVITSYGSYQRFPYTVV